MNDIYEIFSKRNHMYPVLTTDGDYYRACVAEHTTDGDRRRHAREEARLMETRRNEEREAARQKAIDLLTILGLYYREKGLERDAEVMRTIYKVVRDAPPEAFDE